MLEGTRAGTEKVSPDSEEGKISSASQWERPAFFAGSTRETTRDMERKPSLQGPSEQQMLGSSSELRSWADLRSPMLLRRLESRAELANIAHLRSQVNLRSPTRQGAPHRCGAE